MGGPVGGQITPMSFVALYAPEPVLSPTLQLLGTPARSRLSPVLFATSHLITWSRDDRMRASPRTIFRSSSSIASGVVVSRGSPGPTSFNPGSSRSSRVTTSPTERRYPVDPLGRQTLSD